MYSKWTRVQIQNTGLLQREEKECDRRLSLGQQHFNYIMGLVFLSPVASPFTSDRSHRLRWIARCFRTRAIIDAQRRHKDDRFGCRMRKRTRKPVLSFGGIYANAHWYIRQCDAFSLKIAQSRIVNVRCIWSMMIVNHVSAIVVCGNDKIDMTDSTRKYRCVVLASNFARSHTLLDIEWKASQHFTWTWNWM